MRAKFLMPLLGAFILTGCSTSTVSTVILLPEEDGHESSLVVSSGDQTVTLSNPYEAAKSSGGQPSLAVLSQGEVEDRYGATLAAMPRPPMSFTLYFYEGSDGLLPSSAELLDDIYGELDLRPAPQIQVTGYTDTVGKAPDNDVLAAHRADVLRRILVDYGIPEDLLLVVGRGERELAVQTPDETPEPQNRRVVVTIR